MNRALGLLILVSVPMAGGCSVGDWADVTRNTAQEYWSQLLDKDPDAPPPIEREARNEGWKQHWQSEPGANPAMAEAYGADGE